VPFLTCKFKPQKSEFVLKKQIIMQKRN